MMRERSVGVRGRRAARNRVDDARALTGTRCLTDTLSTLAGGRRNRIAWRRVVAVHDPLVGIVLVGIACNRITRCRVGVIHDPLIGMVLVADHAWIFWSFVGALRPRAGAYNHECHGGTDRQK